MKRISIHSVNTFLLTFIIAFFFGCSGKPKPSADQSSKPATEESATPATDQDQGTADTGNSKDSSNTAIAQADTAGQSSPQEKIEVAPIETTTPTSVTSTTTPGLGGLSVRKVSDNKLTTILELIARNLEAKKLQYLSELGQDCSGIFHQLKDSVQVRIPALTDQSKYTYPSFNSDRNSRQIADWYYRNGNLHIVQDALADRNKIRPGTVMFYGRTDEKYSTIDIDLLTNPGKFVHDGSKGKIFHVAVVTSVEKDDAGNVTKYTIMHGRNSRRTASRSSGNYDGPGSYKQQFAKFPFGNWNQQWVAMAYIETAL